MNRPRQGGDSWKLELSDRDRSSKPGVERPIDFAIAPLEVSGIFRAPLRHLERVGR